MTNSTRFESNDTIHDFDGVLPHYRTSLAGNIKYANSALLGLLGYSSLADLQRHDVLHLYANKNDRRTWLESLLAHGRTDMAVQFKKAKGGHVWVRDIATLPPIQTAKGDGSDSPADEVVGFLIPIEEEQNRKFYCEKLLNVTDFIFEHAKVGIIKLDSSTRVIYANEYMRRHFSEIAYIVSNSLPLDSLVEEGGNDADRLNVALESMILTGRNTSEPIAVTMQLPNSRPTPVSIQLFHVSPGSHVDYRTSTICKIQDLRLPPLIEAFMREYGPRHSLLEDLNIKTIIKGRTCSEAGVIESRFVWANKAFLDEINKPLDHIRGKTDRELFPKHFEQYHKRDTFVLQTKGTIQTIEQHPTVDGGGQDHVFVMKTTVEPYDHVHVYYWSYSGGEFERICSEMSSRIGNMYVSILDGFPFPIFLRNEFDRFVYANKAFCGHIGSTRLNVIGMTDSEIFADHAELALEYLAVDRRVRGLGHNCEATLSTPMSVDGNEQGDCSITREELNVDSTGVTHRVIVTKTPIPVSTSPLKLGVEGVFWAKHDIERRLAKGAAILKECSIVAQGDSPVDIFVSYAKEDRKWLSGDDESLSRGEKRELLASLATISDGTRYRFRPWFDGDIKQEWRTEIESAMAECRVAIILLSTHYFDKEGFAYNVEAPVLLNRAEREGGAFTLLVVQVDDYPKIDDDVVQMRLDRFTTVNRLWAGGTTMNELSDAARKRVWSRLAEAVKTFLLSRANSK